MGTVEWPIIIANRNIFDSNPNNEPTIEKNWHSQLLFVFSELF